MKLNLYNSLKTLLLIILLTTCSTKPPIGTVISTENQSTSTIKIASFNMQIFGQTKLKRPNVLDIYAKIAANFDMIALQEVGTNKAVVNDETCHFIMQTFTAKINEITGMNSYSFIRGNQYAIIYRTNKFTVKSYKLYTGAKTFTFTPLIANFETVEPGSNFDFSIITIHTSPDAADKEISYLKTVIEETQTLYSEPDVICLGDYNADGSYYKEGDETWLWGFNPDVYITGILNSADTTVAASDNTYDRIQMSINCNTDFTGKYGVLKFSEIYDVSKCEGGATTRGTEKAISDHYPVWCEFFIGRDED